MDESARWNGFLKLLAILNKSGDVTLKDLLRSHKRIGLL